MKKLESLLPENETDSTNFAYLYDRVAASWQDPSKSTPQRYGTQGKCVSKDKWEPSELEEPSKVNMRRETVGLPPIEEYMDKIKALCKEMYSE